MLWIVAGVAGVASLAPGIDLAITSDEAQSVDGFAIVRAPDGQFYVDGQVGTATVRFLVDPDAEAVLIAGPDAERIGLSLAGDVTLENVAVGPTRQANVAARIAPAMPVSLLGRAYLSRLAAAEVRGNRLILR